MTMLPIAKIIATDINAKINQVNSAIQLLDEGATVPFIARYRKEMTGGLDDTQLRLLDSRLVYLRELSNRQEVIIESIRSQEKLTTELESKILNTLTKTELEDLYLPFKPKRRSKAQIACEAGLEPLAMTLLKEKYHKAPETLAVPFINGEAGFHDANSVLDGARSIIIEFIVEQAALVGMLRQLLWNEGIITSNVKKDKKEAAIKFSDYFEFKEKIKTIPSHRALALLRGKKEDLLKVDLTLPELFENTPEKIITEFLNLKEMHKWLKDTIHLCWRSKFFPSLSLEAINHLKEIAEAEAIKVFSKNLKDLLLMAPAGNKAILGVDPGQRTGCKIACVDDTGKVLETTVIYPHAPQNQWEKSLQILEALCKKYNLTLVSIGNGTASRESDKLALELCKRIPGLKKIVISEAGASVYSASELAAKEFPDMDVSLRGAVSIARRLQDPLAELVKIDPKSIGVGQYQHDVDQSILSKNLSAVVEDCVNAVGVDVNTASSVLLAYISGLNKTISENIIIYRNENGAFKCRSELKNVPRLGAKSFEQAAGFLRISGDNPLDRSSVHPESYPVINRILEKNNKTINQVIGNSEFLKGLNENDYICERFGRPTVLDIIKELEKPGRDPRPEFNTATFKEGIEAIKDLKEGMILEGVVTNVANFGAFVDIGVHQDGLVHISALSDRFVKAAHEVVKVGDIVKVKVLDIDIPRNRIQLTMRLTDDNYQTKNNGSQPHSKSKSLISPKTSNNNVFADALNKFKK